MNTLKTNNVKCHIKLSQKEVEKVIEKFCKCYKCEKNELDLCPCECKVYHWQTFKVFMYIASRILNFTGITSFEQVQETVNEFCCLCNIARRSAIIDNSSSSIKTSECFNLFHLTDYFNLYRLTKTLNQSETLHNIKIERVRTNLQRFPAVRVKTSIGSLNFFSSGSIIILGVKNKQNLSKIEDFVRLIKDNYLRKKEDQQ
jgi:hypothetical protein